MAQSSQQVVVTLNDARDANLRIIIAVPPRGTTGQLQITEGAAVVCNVTAAVSQDVRATCGSTAVDITVSQQADGSIAGQMVTTGSGQ